MLRFKRQFLVTSKAGIVNLHIAAGNEMGSHTINHFIFKKRASHALRIHLCKILTGHCW